MSDSAALSHQKVDSPITLFKEQVDAFRYLDVQVDRTPNNSSLLRKLKCFIHPPSLQFSPAVFHLGSLLSLLKTNLNFHSSADIKADSLYLQMEILHDHPWSLTSTTHLISDPPARPSLRSSSKDKLTGENPSFQLPSTLLTKNNGLSASLIYLHSNALEQFSHSL